MLRFNLKKIFELLSLLFTLLAPVCVCAQYIVQSTDGYWLIGSSNGFTPRFGLASASLDGKIYVFGGSSTSTPNSNKLEVYEPTSDKWQTPFEVGIFIHRRYFTASVINNLIYLIGGIGEDSLSYIQIFEPSSGIWSTPQTAGIFNRRNALTASVVDSKIYLIGGDGYEGTVNSLELFDPSSNTWEKPSTTGHFTARRDLTSNVVNGKIYVMGGQDSNNIALNTLEIFDPKTNSWTSPTVVGNMTPRWGMTSSVVNGKIYVIGGNSGNLALNIIEVFDPAINTWSKLSPSGLFTARYWLTSSVVDNRVYVLGGAGKGGALNTNEVFTPFSTGVVINSSKPEIALFPNPTGGDIVTVTFPLSIVNSKLTIFDVLGREVYNENIPIGISRIEIPITSLPKGPYFVRIGSQMESFVRTK